MTTEGIAMKPVDLNDMEEPAELNEDDLAQVHGGVARPRLDNEQPPPDGLTAARHDTAKAAIQNTRA